MTSFIGVPVSLEAGEVPEQAELVALLPRDRHVTLAFLGRAPEEDFLAVWGRVPEVALPATASARRWECFGRSAVALVLADPGGYLEAAASSCHSAAEGTIDVQPPSSFQPHVTMARVPRRGRRPSAAALRRWPLPAGRIDLGPLTLFRSRADASGGRYEVVDQRPVRR